MTNDYVKLQAKENFQKVHNKGLVASLLNIIVPNEHNKLLSFYDIRELLGKREEIYLGLRVVPIEKIIGSEGRYQDFTRSFLPKSRHLQERWVRISEASQKDIILPPIQLFKVGDAYFVRDGNHRVSVAIASGTEMIDAEVTEIASNIYVSPNMTRKQILQRIIDYERKMIFKESRLVNYIDTKDLIVTSPGSYHLLIHHIMGHKYFLEQERRKEWEQKQQQGALQEQQDGSINRQMQEVQKINPMLAAALDKSESSMSFREAAQAWYRDLFVPIVQLIRRDGLLAQFPDRTAADLYIWLISHWQYLKELHGDDFSLEDAVLNYSKNTPTKFVATAMQFLCKIVQKLKS